MNLDIQRDLVFFDIESTGLNVVRDRIIQLALIKYTPGQAQPEERTYLVNPGIPIPPEATAVHGFTAADVAGQPPFEKIANELFAFIGDADLAGYNSNRFDIPVLMEEFARAGIEFELDGRRLIDVQRIFYKMEPRTLSAAYQFYCGKTMTNAHDALEDVRATIAVLDGQLEKYKDVDFEPEEGELISAPIQPDIETLHAFTQDTSVLDVTQRLRFDQHGEVVFNFGKYMGKRVAEVLSKDKQYYQWMLEKDFSHQVKKIIRQLVADYEQSRKA